MLYLKLSAVKKIYSKLIQMYCPADYPQRELSAKELIICGINNPLCYKVTTVGYKEDRELNVFSWNPGLKHLDIAMLRIPYEPWDDEYTIQLAVNKLGKYAVIPNHDNRSIKGFCKHIGANDHINNIIKGTNEIIIGRQHFPDKQEIQLKDI
jgi:hypothetical protein